MSTTETLTSLAMLRVNTNEGRDYVEYLTPFVSFVLDKERPEVVTDAGTQSMLQAEFGLALPKHAVAYVLGRLAKRGLLRREKGVFYITGSFGIDHLKERRTQAAREKAVIVNNLIRFADEEHNLDWDEASASKAIVSYLNRFSVDFLKTFAQGTALPDTPPATEEEMFIVSSFVKRLHDLDYQLFGSFANLVKGHMLANALLCEDLESLNRKFDGLVVYFDTPLIMRLLKFWGPAQFEAAKELLDLLVKLNARLAVFDHTVNETEHVINYCESVLENPRVVDNEMILSLRREEISVSDLAVCRLSLTDVLSEMGITVYSAPPHYPKYEIDESKLEEVIDVEISYANPKARLYDIDSIRSIFTLRKSRHPRRLEDAAAVFVTTNGGLARAAFNYGKQHESAAEVSTVITDFSLANTAWLKAPLGAPDLPRLELIAECFAALEPPPGLWTRYLDEIAKLEQSGKISPDDHQLLRLSVKARDELMNLTLGKEEAFSDGTVTAILARVKAELTKEKQVEIDAERSLHLSESTGLIAEKDAAKYELAATKEAIEKRRMFRTKRLFWLSSSVGTWARRSAFGVILSILIAIAILGVFLVPLSTTNLWIKIASWAAVAIGAVLSIVGAAWGITAMSISAHVGRMTESVVFKLLRFIVYGSSQDEIIETGSG